MIANKIRTPNVGSMSHTPELSDAMPRRVVVAGVAVVTAPESNRLEASQGLKRRLSSVVAVFVRPYGRAIGTESHELQSD